MVALRCATTGAAQRCAFARTHAWATLTIALAEAAHGSPMLRRASTLVALTLPPPLDEERKRCARSTALLQTRDRQERGSRLALGSRTRQRYERQ
jgi:hypothetical protein